MKGRVIKPHSMTGRQKLVKCRACGVEYNTLNRVHPHVCKRDRDERIGSEVKPLPGQRALPGFGVEDVPLPSEGGASE